ncbi:Aquaporin-9, putative [Pediculus humanus corporis]|uniref:Aquaporin-9, putative n=1 Tax=Pediculus humanus subsp. corporis TaxID=121224 RepID=E0VWA9_PEDHC|nr:Aquaporin-9, putative [Pediculus humanus corporis]EEB17665.1 Aquaporin-9, putative [Pediculus humanus corporis]
MVTFGNSYKSIKNVAREFLAEFIGTFLLVFMGNSAVAQTTLTDGTGGNNITIYFGYGFGLFLGVSVAGGISGGHLNPAVSVAAAIVKKFKWRKIPHYILAQYLGAFLGACITYLLYIDSFKAFHSDYGINKTTAGIFATYPKNDLSVIGSFIDQILGSMILVLGINAITDPFNKIPSYLVPIYVSLTLISIACSLGINQGFAINPARDLSPRFFTYITDWGSDVFDSSSYWYVTIIGSHVGAILGAVIYMLIVEKMRLIRENPTEMIQSNVTIIKNKPCDTNKADDYFYRF